MSKLQHLGGEVPGRNAVYVEVLEANEDPFVFPSIEDVVAVDVSRVKTREVGRSE